jgi:all-trans-8'-apo-beta-carotenal 15,15'-oxygenase
VSNISVVMQDDRLLSLWEGGAPYALDPRTLETLGLEDFGGKVAAFSAHPKIDSRSGELFNFGIDYGLKTTLTRTACGPKSSRALRRSSSPTR